MPWIPRRERCGRCLERGEAAAVDELGEEYRSATHERAVEALAAEEDAARGQLVGEEREDMCGLHRDAVDSEERAVRRLPGARRGCSCGRARRGVQGARRTSEQWRR
ncbi:hypothetical protein TcYC6_0092590 [Trypanosoma cruzi]|nr:hypothetical protein TcYC6_0092590 [Trypanosoma cruzi]